MDSALAALLLLADEWADLDLPWVAMVVVPTLLSPLMFLGSRNDDARA